MKFECPTCRRTFDEVGFCPFDRGPLAAIGDSPTVISEQFTAQPAPLPVTRIDPAKPTMPLTRSSREVAVTAPASQFASVSALAGAANAMASFQIPANEYEALVGQTLDGRYYIERKIGEGGMGVVYAARHAVIERPLAIKVLKREVMRDAATIKRFEQEAKAASRIGHPNIVDVTDFGTTPTGMTYQVMEYVAGVTLGAALRKSAPFPLTRTIRVGTQIARALGAAHEKGIIHRDLKPENVFLLDRDGRTDFVKIVDFGIAKVSTLDAEGNRMGDGPKLTRAGSVFGTPEYMAPEQAAGRADVDGRVDLYALGVLLYEMTTGRVPHRGETMVRTLAMVMMDPIEPPSKVRPDVMISTELELVIMKALAKKREDRYPTMAALVSALEQIQEPIGVSLTGSPVYALMALPPGADASAIGPVPNPSLGQTAPIVIPVPLTERGRARPETQRRPRDEPEFVARDRPHTFEHVFAEEDAALRARRWPVLVAVALLLGVGGGAYALYLRQHPRGVAATRAGLAVASDALDAGAAVAVVAPTESDADPTALAPSELDASMAVAVPAVDAAAGPGRPHLHRDAGGAAGVGLAPVHRPVGIQVITKPEGANLYVGAHFAGPDRTTIEQPFGARVTVVCKAAGYQSGAVALVYDGKTEVAMCVLHRDRNGVCVPDLKNPFDECGQVPATK